MKGEEMTREKAIEIIRRYECNSEHYEACEMAIKALEQEPCDDCISREAAICLADELKDDLPDDDRLSDMVMSHNEGILEYQTQLSLLPFVQPKQRTGHWIGDAIQGEIDGQIVKGFTCSKCGAISLFRMTGGKIVNGNLCPNCSAKMQEVEG